MFMAVPVDAKPPVIRVVCKEAWIITKKCGQFILGYNGARMGGYWFNPRKDMVYLRDSDLVHEFDRNGGRDQFLTDEGRTRILEDAVV
jgi:hypothetical protein